MCLRVKLVCFDFHLFTENQLKACPKTCKRHEPKSQNSPTEKVTGHW